MSVASRARLDERALAVATLALVAAGLCACRDDHLHGALEEAPPRCERAPLPAFVVGANVVDLPDDRDEDPANDGLRGYGSDKARAALDALDGLGLDGVVLPIPVYAPGIHATEVRPGSLGTPAGTQRLARMIDDAHARGFRVVLVPHLVLEDGGWRGELAPRAEGLDEEAAIARFFESYRAAISPFVAVAEARCVEALSVAVELKSLTRRPEADAPLEALVRGVRERFGGEVLYSANWDEVDTVRRWDLFDRVGVQAFHPLASAKGQGDDALARRAREIHASLLALKERTGRPVWFMEAGFKAIPEPHVEPWKWPDEVNARALPVDEAAQARAYRALVGALREVPAVDGVFFWVVPSDLDDRAHPWAFEPAQGFSFLDKEAERVVEELARNRPARAKVRPSGDHREKAAP